jgi:hypothetical protein
MPLIKNETYFIVELSVEVPSDSFVDASVVDPRLMPLYLQTYFGLLTDRDIFYFIKYLDFNSFSPPSEDETVVPLVLPFSETS